MLRHASAQRSDLLYWFHVLLWVGFWVIQHEQRLKAERQEIESRKSVELISRCYKLSKRSRV